MYKNSIRMVEIAKGPHEHLRSQKGTKNLAAGLKNVDERLKWV
jgi:hypothetical protein